jgi:phosphoribosylpyrophosphate synthetase
VTLAPRGREAIGFLGRLGGSTLGEAGKSAGTRGVTVGQGEVLRFSEGTLLPRVLENVRGRRVYLVQSTVFPANDHQRSLHDRDVRRDRPTALSGKVRVVSVAPLFAGAIRRTRHRESISGLFQD